jgi:hypothetical protein
MKTMVRDLINKMKDVGGEPYGIICGVHFFNYHCSEIGTYRKNYKTFDDLRIFYDYRYADNMVYVFNKQDFKKRVMEFAVRDI